MLTKNTRARGIRWASARMDQWPHSLCHGFSFLQVDPVLSIRVLAELCIHSGIGKVWQNVALSFLPQTHKMFVCDLCQVRRTHSLSFQCRMESFLCPRSTFVFTPPPYLFPQMTNRSQSYGQIDLIYFFSCLPLVPHQLNTTALFLYRLLIASASPPHCIMWSWITFFGRW